MKNSKFAYILWDNLDKNKLGAVVVTTEIHHAITRSTPSALWVDIVKGDSVIVNCESEMDLYYQINKVHRKEDESSFFLGFGAGLILGVGIAVFACAWFSISPKSSNTSNELHHGIGNVSGSKHSLIG